MRVITKEVVTILYDHSDKEEALTISDTLILDGYRIISKAVPFVAPYQNKIIMEKKLIDKEDKRI